MAFTIMNNSSAMLALGETNKNNTALSKSLKKVSSGMRLNSAGDGASDYAISEKMRVMIRSLNQDEENVKKGINLINTAEGGIQNIVTSLRSMKALALNSANDHNSDIDRKILQKSFSSYIDNIDDIASTTNYDGRYLLNGNYGNNHNVVSIIETGGDDSKELIFHTSVGDLKYDVTGDVRYNTYDGLFPNSPEYESFGGIRGYGAAFEHDSLYKGLERMITISKSNQYRTWWFNYPDPQGKTSIYKDWKYTQPFQGIPQVGDYIYINGDSLSINRINGGYYVMGASETTISLGIFKKPYPIFQSNHELDFTNFNGTVTNLDNGGFTIFCQGCYNSIGIKFDCEQDLGQAEELYGYLPTSEGAAADPNAVYAYVVGIKGVTDLSDVPEALYKGLSKLLGTKKTDDGYDSVLIGGRHSVEIIKKNNKYILHKRENVHFVIAEGFQGSITGGTTKATSDPISMPVDNKPKDEKYNKFSSMNPKLVIHHGPKSAQHLNVIINNMHSSNMGLDDAGIDPREKALESLEKIDNAIDYALNEIVRMGAYQSRLGFTLENITTANENTMSAESVIRDADMAKEMTQYTKESILSQTAQAILTQANKKSSDVLSLLES